MVKNSIARLVSAVVLAAGRKIGRLLKTITLLKRLAVKVLAHVGVPSMKVNEQAGMAELKKMHDDLRSLPHQCDTMNCNYKRLKNREYYRARAAGLNPSEVLFLPTKSRARRNARRERAKALA